MRMEHLIGSLEAPKCPAIATFAGRLGCVIASSASKEEDPEVV
jgi:hypothetical protein